MQRRNASEINDMPKSQINLGELAELLASGPEGREKIEKQAKAINELQEALMLVVKRTRPYKVPIKSDENTIRFGLIGDIHIGSLYQRIDALQLFYEQLAGEGIDTVLCAGDIVDGWKVYRGQEFELHPYGRSWADQRAMFAEKAPRIDGMKTIFITGNHDASFKNLVGMVVGDELCQIRPDWEFVGQDVGDVDLTAESGDKLRVRLFHPGGGTAYAMSYRIQKIIESLAGGEKPDLLAVGHYHKAEFIPAYRNIAAIQVGTFQSQTPFMVRLASQAHVGGWIVEATLGGNLTSRIKAEFISFMEPEGDGK